jgi:hypothetical protein
MDATLADAGILRIGCVRRNSSAPMALLSVDDGVACQFLRQLSPAFEIP